METFIGGFIGGLLVIVYMLFRFNRVMAAESWNLRTEARASLAQIAKLENELEKQKAIAASPKIAHFPTKNDRELKVENAQLMGEYEILKNEHEMLVEALNKIRHEVDKSENISSALAIKIRAYLTTVIGSMAS